MDELSSEVREPWVIDAEVPDDIIVFFFECFDDGFDECHMFIPCSLNWLT